MEDVFTKFPRNRSYVIPGVYDIDIGDASWVMTASFIIFTMQTGFGLLESGCVSIKNEANIMMKNIVDVVFGGLSYWIFGYALSFGRSPYTNWFMAFGDFAIDPDVNDPLMGHIFVSFLFQLSFSTTATTIVSGSMAERCDFKAYCIFSLLNTIVYSIPAGWVWGEHGFLKNLGAVDIAGSGPVHLTGGAMALAGALKLGPRLGRYANGLDPLPMGNPVNACIGLFVLFWGWLAFNAGSTYGLSEGKWMYSARAGVMTMLASFGGGIFSILFSLFKNEGRIDVLDVINSILGALVSITAGCFLYSGWEAVIVGVIGAVIVCFCTPLFDKIKIDDPVGASTVHGLAGIWGVVAVGLFSDDPIPIGTTGGRKGFFKGGGFYLLGVQIVAALSLSLWGFITTYILLWFIDKITPLRMDPIDELLGTDLVEHGIHHQKIGITKALDALYSINESYFKKLKNIPLTGTNPIHSTMLEQIYNCNFYRNQSTRIKILDCPKCKKELSYSDLLKYHLTSCEENDEILPGKMILLKRRFPFGKKNKINDLSHSQIDLICHVCFRRFYSEENFEEHLTKHLGMRCDICFREFASHDDIFQHKRHHCKSFMRQ